jgi:hypothetical protein
VAERGGLHVIGTNRHESRRIDDQLRGRAGRQGDPGSSRFFVSAEDDLFAKHAEPGLALAADELQRVTEGRSLDLRLFLQKYESVVEGQRQQIQSRRQAVLTGAAPCASETERLATLAAIDDLWAEHLGSVTELREGTVWLALGGREPLHDYLTRVHELFLDLERHVEDVREPLEEALPEDRAALGQQVALPREDHEVAVAGDGPDDLAGLQWQQLVTVAVEEEERPLAEASGDLAPGRLRREGDHAGHRGRERDADLHRDRAAEAVAHHHDA